MGKFKLIEHNSVTQLNYRGRYDDTRKYLKVGYIYDAIKEVHSWHTFIIIDGKKFNSVCFKEIKPMKNPKLSKKKFKELAKRVNTPKTIRNKKGGVTENTHQKKQTEGLAFPSIHTVGHIWKGKTIREVLLKAFEDTTSSTGITFKPDFINQAEKDIKYVTENTHLCDKIPSVKSIENVIEDTFGMVEGVDFVGIKGNKTVYFKDLAKAIDEMNRRLR